MERKDTLWDKVVMVVVTGLAILFFAGLAYLFFVGMGYNASASDAYEYQADMSEQENTYDPGDQYNYTSEPDSPYDSLDPYETTDPFSDSSCNIKGNISFETGEKIYHLPGQEYYDDTDIDESYGERWFCTEAEAQAAGWRKANL